MVHPSWTCFLLLAIGRRGDGRRLSRDGGDTLGQNTVIGTGGERIQAFDRPPDRTLSIPLDVPVAARIAVHRDDPTSCAVLHCVPSMCHGKVCLECSSVERPNQ